MGSFYGNIISHTPRFSFNIAKTYPNRVTMEAESLTDGVDFTQYVLINYNIDKNGQYNESNYSENLNKDQEAYGLINGSSKDFLVNYNQTVWQKSYDQNNNLYYRAIDKLHATLPTFQDISAKNFPIEYMPADYEGFGIEQLYGYYYTNDQESAAIFNDRYPDSEIQITVDQDGSWNIDSIQNKIINKISAIEESITNKTNEVNKLKNTIENAKLSSAELSKACSDYLEEAQNLIQLISDKSYYNEILSWFKLFRQAITESYLHYQSNADLWSNKQKTYGTQTLEYPIK